MCDQQRLRPACATAQSDQSLCLSLEHSMTIKLLPEHHLEFLSLKGGCIGSSESTLVKMPHCLKSHVTAQLSYCSIEMEDFEHATALKHVLLKSQETVSGLKGYVAIGTNYSFGEEIVSKGRVIVLLFKR